ncbi:glycosyltransferase family 4 protein [Trichothermofontia sp.]
MCLPLHRLTGVELEATLGDTPIQLKIITQFFPPDYAPTGQLIRDLADFLSQQGVRVSVFTGQPGYAFQQTAAPKAEAIGPIQVQRTRSTYLWPRRIRGKVVGGVLFYLRSALHLLRHACRHHILVLTTAPPFLHSLGYFIHLIFGTPYVCILYDFYPDIAVQLGVVSERHWLVRLWHRVNQQVWARSQAIVVLTATMQQRLVEKYPAIADKVVVIHNWADPQRIQPIAKHRNWFAQQHQLVNDFVVLYSGNLGRCHDLDTILGAAQLLQTQPQIKFLFIGGGARYPDCQAQVQALGLTNVVFLPYQDVAVLPYSLTAGDLSLVSIGPGMEGLVAPSKLYAALAAGRPIAAICDAHSYLRTLIQEAQCGQSFRHQDSQGLATFIQTLYRNPDLSQCLGRAARQYLQTHFSLAVSGHRYFQVVQGVLATAGRPRLAQPTFHS